MDLKLGQAYLVELCSGELRRWRFLGADERGSVSWLDMETGRVFSESQVMYAWHVVDRADGDQGSSEEAPD
ncbi:MAG: hypothetical protein JNM61_01195 [Zoogloeaceae bacterium]|nr:hypothetical protein [Zoogloeaceae bacterium]